MRLFIDALWSPAGKGLTSWFSFVMSNCEVVTFQLLSWVRCGAGLYRFLIFVLFLTEKMFSFHSTKYELYYAYLNSMEIDMCILLLLQLKMQRTCF